MSDADLARAIAREAGELLRDIQAERAESGKALGAHGDHAANALILRRLHAARPDDFVLSEEAVDDKARCAARRVWIVDPLDGTREYAEARDDWAVHVGLAIDGAPVCGAVAIPATGRVFATDDPAAEWPPLRATPLIVVSRTRPPAIAQYVVRVLDGELVPMGSAGAKAMAVVDGQVDAYIHEGGQYEWDNCAPAAVALAAGLHASRIDGSPLTYNCHDPHLPDLLICRRELAAPILAAIRAR